MLLHLLSDFLRNPALRERFESDPDGVLEEYGVSEEGIASLQRHDFDGVLKLLGEELRSVPFEGERNQRFWGRADLKLQSLERHEAVVNEPTRITLTGEGFREGTQLVLQTPSCSVQGTGIQVRREPTGRSTLTALVQVPAPGTYDVVVLGAGGMGTLPGAFTVRAV
ncbi:hypothetical protein [Vitiosangium sp. GDMCC 1.1324]|uniref:hypothetical protein n=1 Tax=Vitiosangium sp. (strain GDMCC 1.1324) TaxID=2138576 RepID=UPI000D331AD8|nr:hypothetical protein [Vitiosangium sp. GDMCC 1.1324]PTL79158.1 hypothetical protein DAT35_36800 [Vitiosangium sp. GDMCC 1.1324]